GKPSGVAQRRRAEDRQHHVGPGACPPVAESLAEIFVMPLQAELCGRIEEAAKAHGTVRHETAKRRNGLQSLELEQAVAEIPDLPEVVVETGDPILDKDGSDELVAAHHREEEVFVEVEVELVHAPVEPFPGIRYLGEGLIPVFAYG